MRRSILLFAIALAACVAASGGRARGDADQALAGTRPTLYVVSNSHLDTQWNWTVQDTIREFVPTTFRDNFKLFERFPHYTFNFEGAIHYMWFKEYYPEEWRTRAEVRRRRTAGGSPGRLGGSPPTPTCRRPSRCLRQALYGKRFFRAGVRQGQPGRLPARLLRLRVRAAVDRRAHSGLQAFSTQKLTWGAAIAASVRRSAAGREWTASTLVAALQPRRLRRPQIRTDISTDPEVERRPRERLAAAGRSGSATSAPATSAARRTRSRSSGSRRRSRKPPRRSRCATRRPTSWSRDLTAARARRAARVRRRADPEDARRRLLHLAGGDEDASTGRTSCSPMRPSAPASPPTGWAAGLSRGAAARGLDALPLAPVPRRPHRHEHPAGLPVLVERRTASRSTSSPSLTTAGAGAVASALDTHGDGVPLVVYNPLSMSRQTWSRRRSASIRPRRRRRVVDRSPARRNAVAGGEPRRKDGSPRIRRRRAVGRVQGVPRAGGRRPAAAAKSTLGVTATSLENERYLVKIDANGDIASIIDKEASRELLGAPARSNCSTTSRPLAGVGDSLE